MKKDILEELVKVLEVTNKRLDNLDKAFKKQQKLNNLFIKYMKSK